eukprot:TRINITY_DN17_c0_g1_i2.p1 TRINITY_DN17_c0_g1~~TRINITY_DN17_c0_g1_i2.p1  ORF type:complete len:162 (+),score=45.52 TRINITY_DN17_c0_g1_i2:351-836(+)
MLSSAQSVDVAAMAKERRHKDRGTNRPPDASIRAMFTHMHSELDRRMAAILGQSPPQEDATEQLNIAGLMTPTPTLTEGFGGRHGAEEWALEPSMSTSCLTQPRDIPIVDYNEQEALRAAALSEACIRPPCTKVVAGGAGSTVSEDSDEGIFVFEEEEEEE